MGKFPRFGRIEAEKFVGREQIASTHMSITDPHAVDQFEADFYNLLGTEGDNLRDGIETETRYQVTVLSERGTQLFHFLVLPDLISLAGETAPDDWFPDPEGKLWRRLENGG